MKHIFSFRNENFIYYDPEDITEILNRVPRDTISKNKVQYYNSANAFDIETTSYIHNGKKLAFMYMWSFALSDDVIIGRTWEQFIEVCNKISESMVTYSRRRFVVYIHNESFEFQWFRKWFEWERVFSLDRREPILAVTTSGIEFRCSYHLSGYALKDLPVKKYKKLVGAVDYSLVRHSKTPLDNALLAYSIRDVQTVVEYIRGKITEDGGITKIPMTKTGYVRKECRASCFGRGKHDDQYKQYMDMIGKLTIFPEEYAILKEAFQGGFTHANAFYVRQCERGKDGKHYLENVGSFDITSDYPAEMVAENGFPMSKGRFYNNPSRRLVKESIANYFCVLDVTLYGLEDIVHIDNPISLSRCTDYAKKKVIQPNGKVKTVKDVIVNNGRVVSAGYVRLTITHIDLEVIQACYNYDRIEVHRLIRYKRGYLPTPFIKQVLEFYKAKTKLKGLTGFDPDTGEEYERRYMWGKENVNSTFGCTVTDVCQPLIVYNEDLETIWEEQEVDVEKTLSKYNKQKNRFLFYPWGVAITSFARRRLWGVMLAVGWDYVYSDTDSVKILHPEKHLDIFKRSDEIITEKLKRAVKHHGLTWDDVAPKNQKGEPKQLGLWEWEHTYRKFRTCGSKRYMCEYDNALEIKQYNEDGTEKILTYDLTLTVSGLNKKTAIPYLLDKYGTNDEVFKHFTSELEVPPPHAGRMVSYYLDDEMEEDITDYLGNVYRIHERSGVAFENTSYTMDNVEEYERYKAYINDWVGVYDPQFELERSLHIE